MTVTATMRRDSRAAHSPHPLLFKPAASSRHRNVRRADFSLHAYVGADPVNWTDPDGLAPNEIIINAPPRPQNPPQPPRFGTFGPVSPGAGGNPERGEDDSAAECAEEENCVLVTAKKKHSRLTRIIRSIGHMLDRGAERHLRPPEGRRPNESFIDCVNRVGGPNLAAGGAVGIYFGGAFVPYGRGTPGGGGTSVISSITRAALPGLRMDTRILGTNSVGGAIGRGLSKTSVIFGAAAAGLAAGKTVGAVQICRK